MFYKSGTGNSKLRSQHQRTVYRCIINHQPISRTDITRYTKISKPTVTRITEEFLDAKLIVTSGYTETVLGRKPELLKVCEDALAAIGLYFTKTSAHVSLMNIKTTIMYRRKISHQHIQNLNDFYRFVDELLIDAIAAANEQKTVVLGVGVAAPGNVNCKKGTIESFFGTEELIPIVDHIEKRFKMASYVDNNANVSALAEWYCGLAKDDYGLIYFIASSGIGAGIIDNNALLRGKNNSAGEIGKSLVMLSNQTEQAESIASIPVIVKKYSEISGKTIDESDLFELYSNYDEDLKKLVDQSTQVLYLLVYNLLCTVDVSPIIFSGKYFDYFPKEFIILKKKLKEKLHESSMNEVAVHLRKQDETINFKGPGIIVFDNVLYQKQ
ncbi:MAG: ROK family transcriptional regulator [Acholeplasmataceae bacterium]